MLINPANDENGRELSLWIALAETLVSRTFSFKQWLDVLLSLLDDPIDVFVTQAASDHKLMFTHKFASDNDPRRSVAKAHGAGSHGWQAYPHSQRWPRFCHPGGGRDLLHDRHRPSPV